MRKGVNHIEIRNVDLNPFAEQGIDARDLQFIELLVLFLVSGEEARLAREEQEIAVENFKKSALFDIDAAKLRMPGGEVLSARDAGIHLLKEMKAFYASERITAAPYELGEILDVQEKKLTVSGRRYAERCRAAIRDLRGANGILPSAVIR